MKQDSHFIDDENKVTQLDFRRQRQQSEKEMEYGRNIIEEKKSKLYSCLLQKLSAIDPLLYSFHNKKTLIE